MRGKVRKARNRGDGMWMQEVWGVNVLRLFELVRQKGESGGQRA
jgi:hypothetical protein